VPNCSVDGCQAAHHPLLHGALVEGYVMVVQGIGGENAQVYLCRKDVRVEGAGKVGRLHTLYDWGATVTLVTHSAAEKAGLKPVRQSATAIAGLGGKCTMVDSYYMVPVIDRDDEVQSVKALQVDYIATSTATETSAGQGLRREASQAGGRCGDANRHGQSGMDAQARGKQPGQGGKPSADAVYAEPAS
jgi:hypothetical protein